MKCQYNKKGDEKLGTALDLENKKPLTKEDYTILMAEIYEIKNALGISKKTQTNQKQQNDSFVEIKSRKFEGNKNEP